MQSGKRKEPEDGKVNEATVNKEVTDGEVEEFFAILRRIRVAVKYFENCNAGGGMAVKRWKPSFEKEDFLVEPEKKKEEEEEVGVEENKGLDLNVGLEAEDSSI